MAKINTVVVLCNGDVYGTWLLSGEHNCFSVAQKNNLRHAILEKVKQVDTDDVFTVQFDEMLPADTLGELCDGILESIENSY
jgi:hypothetical protein